MIFRLDYVWLVEQIIIVQMSSCPSHLQYMLTEVWVFSWWQGFKSWCWWTNISHLVILGHIWHWLMISCCEGFHFLCFEHNKWIAMLSLVESHCNHSELVLVHLYLFSKVVSDAFILHIKIVSEMYSHSAKFSVHDMLSLICRSIKLCQKKKKKSISCSCFSSVLQPETVLKLHDCIKKHLGWATTIGPWYSNNFLKLL